MEIAPPTARSRSQKVLTAGRFDLYVSRRTSPPAGTLPEVDVKDDQAREGDRKSPPNVNGFVRYFGSKSGRNAHKTATFASGSGLVAEPS